MTRLALLIGCAALAACNQASGTAAPSNTLQASAEPVDGDTVAVHFRLLGVDAVEGRQQCERDGRCWKCGKVATAVTERMLDKGETTIAMTGEQTYGRPVATVVVDGEDLGLALIGVGFAAPLDQYLQHDPERLDAYERAYEQAKAAKRGVHSGRWIMPSLWRKGSRLSCERRSRS
ncbi:thermonuclease family protein [Novosphingobium sp. 9U]|uniref:thermonuclease family protein n=1 Tax=Novosphingobium sp. 9U TaxID=2653158 RepID=UPI0012F3CB17|nr:thermonuclease family protein [Novosphingobium sp. 9U]VWX51044.1 Thermonuclease family protein [Novosphingobium sp. 9U]